MLRLFRRTRKTAPKAAPGRRARLGLESLEGRAAPATLSLGVAYPGGHYTSFFGTSWSPGGRCVTLSGTLSDHENPSLQTINFSGQVSGSTRTNMQGQYSVTLQATGLGTVSATAQDGSSNPAEVTLTDVTPSLTFNATEGMDHVWTLYGHVTYTGRPYAGVQVYFGGEPVSLQSCSPASVASNGDYQVCVTLNGTCSDNGIASVTVLTPWGTWSSPDYESILQAGT